MYSLDRSTQPVKLVRLKFDVDGADWEIEDTLSPQFESDQEFRNCFLVNKNRLLLFTWGYLSIYDLDFKEIDQLEVPYIQDDIWYVLSSQLSIENDIDMYIACEMKRDFVDDFRKRQEDKVSFFYEG